MSESLDQILSREELDAILSTLAEESESARAEATAQAGRRSGWDSAPLARALRDFGEEHARALSTLHQRPLSFELISLTSLSAAEFAESLLESDRPALLEFESHACTGAILMGRSFVFGWLGMAFGGPPTAQLYVPARSFTAIEERFMHRCIDLLLAPLPRFLAMTPAPQLRAGPLVEPMLISDLLAGELQVASFDVSGFGEVSRLRIAIPAELCAPAPARRPVPAKKSKPSELRDQLLDVPVRLHAEVGWRDIGLRALRGLRKGDRIDLESRTGGEVIVRLEGEAKFYAERGRSSERVAIRITEKL